MGTVVNYITCPKGHKVFVVWVPSKGIFGFTCDDCEQISKQAISMHGLVGVKLVKEVSTQ